MNTIAGQTYQADRAIEQSMRPSNGVQGINDVKNAKNPEEVLRKVASDFEAIFTQMLMKAMRKTIHKSDLMSGGRGEEIFQGMLDMEISKGASVNESKFGISDMIVQKYMRNIRNAGDTLGKSLDARESVGSNSENRELVLPSLERDADSRSIKTGLPGDLVSPVVPFKPDYI